MAARDTKTQRRLVLAAVLGSSAVLAILSARTPQPREVSPRTEPPRPSVIEPGDEVVTYGTGTHRPVLLIAVLVASAVVGLWSAHQQHQADGAVIAGIGYGGIAAAMWAVAFRWGDLRPDEGFGRMSFGMLGLLLLACFGPALVTELALTDHGKPIAAEVAVAGPGYRLVVPGGSTPLPGDLRTTSEFAGGERVTALVDRDRLVRPMLRDEVDPALRTGFVLAGTGILAIALLSLGSPLRTTVLPRNSG